MSVSAHMPDGEYALPHVLCVQYGSGEFTIDACVLRDRAPQHMFGGLELAASARVRHRLDVCNGGSSDTKALASFTSPGLPWTQLCSREIPN